jgi:hypothetical protein
VFNVVPKFFEFIGAVRFPSYLNPVIIGTAVSLIVTIVISRKTTVTEEEINSLTKPHETPAEEISLIKSRLSVIAACALILYGLIMPVLMVVYYVQPFQEARGELLPDGSINWFTGEALLALSWFFIYVNLGLFAANIIHGSYSPVRQQQNRENWGDGKDTHNYRRQ